MKKEYGGRGRTENLGEPGKEGYGCREGEERVRKRKGILRVVESITGREVGTGIGEWIGAEAGAVRGARRGHS